MAMQTANADGYDGANGSGVPSNALPGGAVAPTPGKAYDVDVGMQEDETAILFPVDSYIGETYWGDLPARERLTWMLSQQWAEDRREWGNIWRNFKMDPLQPFGEYFRRYVMTGLGLFTEGYILFSIGNLKTLYSKAYPKCWGKKPTDCNVTWTQTTDYLQVVGIMFGQVGVGILGDGLGRRYGMIQDAAIMLLGCIMITVSNGVTIQGWIVMYALSQFVYGCGVGGEYPMTGTSCCEVEVPGSRADRLHRGRNVVLAFTMQGWGQFANVAYLILALLVFNAHGGPPYGKKAAGAIWRSSFGVIAIFILYLLYYRIYKLKNVDKWLNEEKRESRVVGYDWVSFGLLWSFYWHRLVGTAGTWFCNDFMFYGNKVFQGEFITVISGSSATVLTNWLWTMCNVGVELAGYYMAALTIDWKFFGRMRMQALGFFADFVLFLIPAIIYSTLVKKANIGVFQFIYFFSSFWNQFGPNCTTFLVAAEVYPASVRATGHGISAAVGKLGALVPTIMYNYIANPRTRFWIVTWFGLLGFVLTYLFIPDTTGLDLREQERRWRYIREGRHAEYHGIAIHPRHLSVFERMTGMGRHYNPALDSREDRLVILRQLQTNNAKLAVGKTPKPLGSATSTMTEVV